MGNSGQEPDLVLHLSPKPSLAQNRRGLKQMMDNGWMMGGWVGGEWVDGWLTGEWVDALEME